MAETPQPQEREGRGCLKLFAALNGAKPAAAAAAAAVAVAAGKMPGEGEVFDVC